MKTTFIFSSSLIICGIYVFVACNRAGIPDTELGNWVQAAAIGAYPRSNSVSFVIGDHAYVGLGYNESIGGSGRLTDCWTFCVDSGWTQVQDFPGAPRSNAAGFSIGNEGYVGTGYDGLTTYSDFYQYDPVQNAWTRKSDYPGGTRYDAVGFSVHGLGYLGTGFNVYWLNDFYQYDPGQDKWSETPGSASTRSCCPRCSRRPRWWRSTSC